MHSGSEVVAAASHAAGRRVSERLERDQRARHRLVPGALDLIAAGPFGPELLGRAQAFLNVDRLGQRQVRAREGENKRHRFAGRDLEIADGLEILTAHLCGRAQHRHVGTGDAAQGDVIEPRHPRHDRAIGKAQDQLAVECDAPALAFDDPDKLRMRPARRHEIDQHRCALVSLEASLQD